MTAKSRARLAATVTDMAPTLESWVELRRRTLRTPGVQVCIRVDGEVVLSAALGRADLERGTPLTPDHLFRIASHSKTFAATACLLLREEGRLGLDDPVGRHVADVADTPVGALTVRELLGHQAGVIRDGAACDYWQLDGPFPDRDRLVAMLRDEGVTYVPNAHFKYSNFGYSVVGLVVEAVSGMPFARFCRERILDVLDLPRIHPDLSDLPPGRLDELASGHSGRLDGDDEPFVLRHADTGAMCAATGFMANARDLTAYGSAHVLGDTRLLTDGSKRLMQRLETLVEHDGEELGRYGLGFDLHTVGERRLVGHSGGFPGFITRTFVDPRDSLVVSVLTNQSGGPAGEIATGLVTLIDLAVAGSPTREEWEADVVGSPEVASSPAHRLAQAARPLADSGADHTRFTGRFACSFGRLEVARLGDRLVALAPDQPDPTAGAGELFVVDGDTLVADPAAGFDSVGEPWRYERTPDGAVACVVAGGMRLFPEEEFRARRRAMMGR